jgi:hypothetical protein
LLDTLCRSFRVIILFIVETELPPVVIDETLEYVGMLADHIHVVFVPCIPALFLELASVLLTGALPFLLGHVRSIPLSGSTTFLLSTRDHPVKFTFLMLARAWSPMRSRLSGLPTGSCPRSVSSIILLLSLAGAAPLESPGNALVGLPRKPQQRAGGLLP